MTNKQQSQTDERLKTILDNPRRKAITEQYETVNTKTLEEVRTLEKLDEADVLYLTYKSRFDELKDDDKENRQWYNYFLKNISAD